MITILTSKRAHDEALEMEDFWNDKFRSAYDAALSYLKVLPRGGHPYPHRRFPDCRRVQVKGCKAHIYYLYEDQTQTIKLLSVWGASRRRGPFG